MYLRLFLKGLSGSSQAGLLEQGLGGLRFLAGGYVFLPLIKEDGTSVLGMVTPGEAAAGSLSHAAFGDAEVEEDGQIQPSRFLPRFLEALDGIREKQLGILDPVGGLELTDPEAKEKLFALLKADIPCAGVLEDRGDKVDSGSYQELLDLLTEDPQTLILELSGQEAKASEEEPYDQESCGEEELPGKLREWAETILDWSQHRKFDPLARPRFRMEKRKRS